MMMGIWVCGMALFYNAALAASTASLVALEAPSAEPNNGI
jgi:hypothetical protein